MSWFTRHHDCEIALLKERVSQLERAVGGVGGYTGGYYPGPGAHIYVDYGPGVRYTAEQITLTEAVDAIIEKLGLIIQRQTSTSQFLMKGEK